MSGNLSLLFVLDATAGLNPDGKEDGGGTGERGWWPLNSDARITAATKRLKEPMQEGRMLPWEGAAVKKQRDDGWRMWVAQALALSGRLIP